MKSSDFNNLDNCKLRRAFYEAQCENQGKQAGSLCGCFLLALCVYVCEVPGAGDGEQLLFRATEWTAVCQASAVHFL